MDEVTHGEYVTRREGASTENPVGTGRKKCLENTECYHGSQEFRGEGGREWATAENPKKRSYRKTQAKTYTVSPGLSNKEVVLNLRKAVSVGQWRAKGQLWRIESGWEVRKRNLWNVPLEKLHTSWRTMGESRPDLGGASPESPVLWEGCRRE